MYHSSSSFSSSLLLLLLLLFLLLLLLLSQLFVLEKLFDQCQRKPGLVGRHHVVGTLHRGELEMRLARGFVVHDIAGLQWYTRVCTAGPGSDDPELTESTPAETKIVTIVLPSCIILKL